MIPVFDEEAGQGMLEYLLVVSLVIVTILGMVAGLAHLLS
jgi:hypothetical protein